MHKRLLKNIRRFLTKEWNSVILMWEIYNKVSKTLRIWHCKLNKFEKN